MVETSTQFLGRRWSPFPFAHLRRLTKAKSTAKNKLKARGSPKKRTDQGKQSQNDKDQVGGSLTAKHVELRAQAEEKCKVLLSSFDGSMKSSKRVLWKNKFSWRLTPIARVASIPILMPSIWMPVGSQSSMGFPNLCQP